MIAESTAFGIHGGPLSARGSAGVGATIAPKATAKRWDIVSGSPCAASLSFVFSAVSLLAKPLKKRINSSPSGATIAFLNTSKALRGR